MRDDMVGDVAERDPEIREIHPQTVPHRAAGGPAHALPAPVTTPPAAIPPAAGEADRLLDDLQAAGLVDHAAHARACAQGETAVLQALCALVAGPIYRLDALRYAFRLQPGDAAAALAAQAPETWAGILEAALTRASPDAGLRIRRLETRPAPGQGRSDPAPDAALWLLRAWDGAVAEGIAPAGPQMQAVINARFAAETARLTAERTAELVVAAAAERLAADTGTATGAEAAGLADRLDGLEAQIARLAAGLEALHPGGDPEAAAQIATLAETCAVLAQSLERVEADNADFRRTLGRVFGEFLAQIDARDLHAHAAAPQAEADPLQAG